MRNPALPSIIAAYAYALMAVGAVLVALAMPGGGVRVIAADSRVAVEVAGRRIATLPPDARIAVAASGGAIRVPAGELVADFSPRGSHRQVAAWFDTESRLAVLVAGTGARLILPGGQLALLEARSRRLADVPIDTWLLLAQGALLTLLGSWLAAMRPRDPAAWIFGVSCVGMIAASLSGAVYDARELAANGVLLHVCQTVNFAASYLGAAALAAMFAIQPRPLLRMGHVFAAIGLATLGRGVRHRPASARGLLPGAAAAARRLPAPAPRPDAANARRPRRPRDAALDRGHDAGRDRLRHGRDVRAQAARSARARRRRLDHRAAGVGLWRDRLRDRAAPDVRTRSLDLPGRARRGRGAGAAAARRNADRAVRVGGARSGGGAGRGLANMASRMQGIGAAFTPGSAAFELRYEAVGAGVFLVQSDVNHDGVADWSLQVASATPLVAEDFVL